MGKNSERACSVLSSRASVAGRPQGVVDFAHSTASVAWSLKFAFTGAIIRYKLLGRSCETPASGTKPRVHLGHPHVALQLVKTWGSSPAADCVGTPGLTPGRPPASVTGPTMLPACLLGHPGLPAKLETPTQRGRKGNAAPSCRSQTLLVSTLQPARCSPTLTPDPHPRRAGVLLPSPASPPSQVALANVRLLPSLSTL